MQFVKREGAVNPAVDPFRGCPDQVLPNFDTDFPLRRGGIDMPASLQHVRVSPQEWPDLLQFLIGFVPVAEAEPALSRLQVTAI